MCKKRNFSSDRIGWKALPFNCQLLQFVSTMCSAGSFEPLRGESHLKCQELECFSKQIHHIVIPCDISTFLTDCTYQPIHFPSTAITYHSSQRPVWQNIWLSVLLTLSKLIHLTEEVHWAIKTTSCCNMLSWGLNVPYSPHSKYACCIVVCSTSQVLSLQRDNFNRSTVCTH